jgi:hypothetical protein
MGCTLWYSIQSPMQMCQSIKSGIYRKSVESAKWVEAAPGSPRNRAYNSVWPPVTRDLSPYEECAAQSNTPAITLSSNQFRLHTSLSLCLEPTHVRPTSYVNSTDIIKYLRMVIPNYWTQSLMAFQDRLQEPLVLPILFWTLSKVFIIYLTTLFSNPAHVCNVACCDDMEYRI